MHTIDYQYTFSFESGESLQFHIQLDDRNLAVVHPDPKSGQGWTELGYRKCDNCPLSEHENHYCPVALNIQEPLKAFSGLNSHLPVELEVRSPERTYQVSTTLQKGLGSMLGIFMVTSGCPVLDKLRPMVRQHLPVAGMNETRYRAISMYLTAQYFIQQEGGEPDWELKNLANIYKDVQVVNKCMSIRIRGAMEKDAGLNALVVLNHFADFVPFSIDENAMDEIQVLFKAYLNR